MHFRSVGRLRRNRNDDWGEKQNKKNVIARSIHWKCVDCMRIEIEIVHWMRYTTHFGHIFPLRLHVCVRMWPMGY